MCVFFWACTPTIFTVLTFGSFVLFLPDENLKASKVFTAIALFQTLVAPLNAFPWVGILILVSMTIRRKLLYVL